MKINKYKNLGSGWHNESVRHQNAKLFGSAGGLYASQLYAKKQKDYHKTAIASWDTSEIVDSELKYILEHRDEFDQYDDMDEDEIRNHLYEDSDLFDSNWDGLLENLGEIMDRKQGKKGNNHWYAEVENFGWMNRSGEAVINTDDPKELLQKILPDTDCTFYIFNEGKKGFKIQNYHHDSPTGNEWYHIRPMTNKEVDDYNETGDFPK